MSDDLMIADLAAAQSWEHARDALRRGVAQADHATLVAFGLACDWNGNHGEDCDCGIDEGD